jgi:Transposase DDE domain
MSKLSSVFRYRIRNWHDYNRALINRGRLTVWFDEHAIAGWRHTAPATGPGAPRLYADLAIACALVFKAVYHLSLRAAQGFLSSVVELMKLTLPIPDYSTVSRRQRLLSVRSVFTSRRDPRHVVIDATGLKVYGTGEWHGREEIHCGRTGAIWRESSPDKMRDREQHRPSVHQRLVLLAPYFAVVDEGERLLHFVNECITLRQRPYSPEMFQG